jgi:hypothetical protein
MPPTRKCVLGEREREQARRTTEKGSEMGGGGWTPPRFGSFGEREEEREITLPPMYSRRITFPCFMTSLADRWGP